MGVQCLLWRSFVQSFLSRMETYFYHTWGLRLREVESARHSRRLAGQNRHQSWYYKCDPAATKAVAFLRGITSGTFTHGASRLFMPSATVRHHARLEEGNG